MCGKTSLLTFFEPLLTRLNDRYLRHFLPTKTVRITATLQRLYPALPSFPFRCYSQAVERITVWVDDPGVTLVPFCGRTLIANTRRVEVHDITNAWATVAEEADILQAQLATAFPKLRRQALQVLEVRGCVKTEYSKDGARNQHFAIFGDDVHGVRGLVVAIPGKASSMLALGRAVASYLFGRE